MKFIIKEDKVNSLLSKIFIENGLEKTLTITGLDIFELFSKIEPVQIDSGTAYDLIYILFKKYNKVLTKKIGQYRLEFNFDGVMEWVYENKQTKEHMYALCTPYWDGDAITPIDCEYYTNNNFQINKDDDEHYTSFKCPQEFKSISELIDWYENEYIPNVYRTLNQFLRKFRDKIID